MRNYCGKPKNSILTALIQKKSRVIETSGKMLFLFWQKRCQKEKRLFLMKKKTIFLMIKKVCTIFTIFFSNIVSDLKLPNHWLLLFFPKEYTFSQLSLKRLKNIPVFLVLKKESWFSFFIQNDYSRRGIESYPGFKYKKKLSEEWHSHQNYKIEFQYFLNLIYKHFNYCMAVGWGHR